MRTGRQEREYFEEEFIGRASEMMENREEGRRYRRERGTNGK